MRLKPSSHALTATAEKFQFHLVRLKHIARSTIRFLSLISIPLGAIKTLTRLCPLCDVSAFQFHLVRLKPGGISYIYTRRIFQFHLVRLKLLGNCSLFPTKRISIPLGAIKTGTHSNSSGCCTIFQFHLVRLKRCSIGAYRTRKQISIPLGAIKTITLLKQCNKNSLISIPLGAIKTGWPGNLFFS